MSWFKYIKSFVCGNKYLVVVLIMGVFLAALFILPKLGYLQGNNSSSLSGLSILQEDTIGDTGVSPMVTPTLTPKVSLSPMVTPRMSPVSPMVTPTSANKNSQSQSNNYNTPVSPSPAPTIRVSPSLSPSVSPTLTPEVTVSPSVSPMVTPTPDNNTNNGLTVVINEIAWMGTKASQYAEWIELFNNTETEINLDDWSLWEGGGSTKIIVLKGKIGSNGFYLIERTTLTSPDAIIDIESDVFGQFGGAGLLANGEFLVLKDDQGIVIDSVNGLNKWFLQGDNTTKSSMERINPRELGDDSQNWGTNDGQTRNGKDADNNQINGTPKAKNSVCPI